MNNINLGDKNFSQFDFSKNSLLLMSSSEFFITKAPQLYKKNFKDLKIAYINTATKKVSDDSYSKNQIERMKELKWNFKIIDLADFQADDLYKEFEGIDIIYVEGGNTFYLLQQIKKTKFANVVKKLMDKGVLYSGVSAGSYVACPTIDMATWTKPDDFDRFGLSNFEAMGLVPFLLKVHMTPEREKEIQIKIKESKLEVKLLTDEQAILINNEEVYLVD